MLAAVDDGVLQSGRDATTADQPTITKQSQFLEGG